VFNQAVQETWTPERFVAEIRNTPFFQKHADTVRAWSVLKDTDPATAKQKLGATAAQIDDIANAMGSTLSPAQALRIAENALMFGLNESQLKNTLATYVHYDAKLRGFQGEAGQNESRLQEVALKNGLRYDQGMYQKWVTAIASGTSTVTDYERYIRNEAAKAFPHYSEQLSAGADLADIASPFTNSMAQILEISPNDINLFDPTIRQALQSRDKDGKIVAKPLWQFETELRKDPRWQSTRNAQNALQSAGTQVLQAFGVMS
jgi:hypothetical protein